MSACSVVRMACRGRASKKDAADYFPDWIKTVEFPKREGGSFCAPIVAGWPHRYLHPIAASTKALTGPPEPELTSRVGSAIIMM